MSAGNGVGRSQPPWPLLLLLAGYGAFAAALTRGVWQSAHPTLVGATSDAVQATWFVGWTGFAVAHGLAPLVTGFISPLGHPVPLMWNNAAPAVGVWLTPVTLLFGAIPAYNVGITAALALSACTTALVVHKVTGRWAGAVVAGLIFGFSPWSMAQAVTGHLSLISLELVPIILWLLAAALTLPDHSPLRSGAALGILATGQLLISQEVLADIALVGGLLAAGWLIAGGGTISDRCRRGGRALIATASTFFVSAAAPLLVAFTGPRPSGHLRFLNPFSYIADPVGLVVPRRGLLLDPPMIAGVADRLPGYFGDATVYLGLPLLLVVAWVALRHRRERWARYGVLLFVVALTFALGPRLTFDGRTIGTPLPWALLLHLPVYGLLIPSRMAPLVYLGGAVCAAVVIDSLARHRSEARWVWAMAASMALVLPLLPAGPLPRWAFVSPRFFTHAAERTIPSASVAAVFPPPQPLTGPDVMLWQLEANFRFRLPWGYAIQPGPKGSATAFGGSGVLTAALVRIAAGHSPRVGPGGLGRIRSELRRWDVQTLVLGPMAHRAAASRLIERVAAASPRWTGGVEIWSMPLA